MTYKEFFKDFYANNPFAQIGKNITLFKFLEDNSKKFASVNFLFVAIQKRFHGMISPDELINFLQTEFNLQEFEHLQLFIDSIEKSGFDVQKYLDILDPPFPELPKIEPVPIYQARQMLRQTGIGIHPFDLHEEDAEIRLVPEDKVSDIISSFPARFYQYIKECRDCDDFARIVRGWLSEHAQGNLAVGVVKASLSETNDFAINSAMHIFLWLLTQTGRLYFVEPQTNGFWLFPEDPVWSRWRYFHPIEMRF